MPEMTQDNLMVSVVVPCFNQGAYLKTLVESVALATKRVHEVVIVNDGSTRPSTLRGLAELVPAGKHQTIRVLNTPNRGLPATRNYGLDSSKGQLIQFLDADDLLTRDAIDKRAHLLIEKGLDVAVCDFSFCNQDANRFWHPDEQSIVRSQLSFQGVARKWERGLTIPIHCGLFKKSVLGSSPFNTSLRAKEDWIFWMQLFLRTQKVEYIEERGAVYRMHDANMTRDGEAMGVAWLEALTVAKASFAQFDPRCAEQAWIHFTKFYVPAYWRKHGNHFPIRFFGQLFEGAGK